jgi:hypothetical protein
MTQRERERERERERVCVRVCPFEMSGLKGAGERLGFAEDLAKQPTGHAVSSRKETRMIFR